MLQLLLEIVRCPAGPQLTDGSLCLAFEECFTLRQRHASSELLEAYAEDILVQFVLVVFARLALIESRDATSPTAMTEKKASLNVAGSASYGVAAFERILRFLASLLNPAKNSRDVRILGLRLVKTRRLRPAPP